MKAVFVVMHAENQIIKVAAACNHVIQVEHKSGHIKGRFKRIQRALPEETLIDYKAMLPSSSNEKSIPIGSKEFFLSLEIIKLIGYCI